MQSGETAKPGWLKEVVAATEKMLWGSLGAVYQRCGQPTCHGGATAWLAAAIAA